MSTKYPVHQVEFRVPSRIPPPRNVELSSDASSVLKSEDGGQALILESQYEMVGGMFLRVHSWQDAPDHRGHDSHPAMRSILGKRVRVTVEVLDD